MGKRNRYGSSNPLGAVRAVEISEIERVFISWLIGQMEGLDKEGSRKVASIIDIFDLENFSGVETERRFDVYPYEMSGYEITYLVDATDKMFGDKKIIPAHAKAAIKLYDNLKAALEDEPESAPEAAEEETE